MSLSCSTANTARPRDAVKGQSKELLLRSENGSAFYHLCACERGTLWPQGAVTCFPLPGSSSSRPSMAHIVSLFKTLLQRWLYEQGFPKYFPSKSPHHCLPPVCWRPNFHHALCHLTYRLVYWFIVCLLQLECKLPGNRDISFIHCCALGPSPWSRRAT